MIKTYVYEEGQPDEGRLGFVEYKVTGVLDIPNAKQIFFLDQTVLVNEDFEVACFLADEETLKFYVEEVGLVLSTLTDEEGNVQRVMAIDMYPIIGDIIQIEEV